MVRHIIENRVADGQFDECDTSIREMAKIEEVLIHSLEASFHTRVEYPLARRGEKRRGAGKQTNKSPKTFVLTGILA
jgi:membrane-associated HD superfamily phosphohydrolase